jgi:hypothetical protein
MEAWALQTIYSKCKLGHSLSQVGELTGLGMDLLKEILGQATGIAPADLSSIFLMTQRGLTLEQISQELDVAVEVLKLFLPEVLPETVPTQIDADQGPYDISRHFGVSERAVLAYKLGSPDEDMSLTSKASEPAPVHHRTPPIEKAIQPQRPQPTQTQPQYTPTFFYSCQEDTNQLHRVNLLTGEHSRHEVPRYQFEFGCRWSELPGGSLLITGGGHGERDVVKIDTLREYAASSQPPMHAYRSQHAAVYHSQYVYVLGGYIESREADWCLRACERYVCAESRWEELANMPVAGKRMSAVELHNSLYALGGHGDEIDLDTYQELSLDTVQKLSLDSLTWQLMQLKLPQAVKSFPCFKKDTEVYLIIKKTLYLFTALEVKRIKTLPVYIICYSSYYSRGTLYYDRGLGIKLTSFS